MFDQKHTAAISGDVYPGERLIACFNPDMADQWRRKRHELLHATEKTLNKVVAEVQRRTKKPLFASDIGVKAGKIVTLDKAAKHFELSIADGSFSWKRYETTIKNEERIDGI